MCDNENCSIHPGEVVEWAGDDSPAQVEAICAHGDIVSVVTVDKTGWWSGIHPANK